MQFSPKLTAACRTSGNISSADRSMQPLHCNGRQVFKSLPTSTMETRLGFKSVIQLHIHAASCTITPKFSRCTVFYKWNGLANVQNTRMLAMHQLAAARVKPPVTAGEQTRENRSESERRSSYNVTDFRTGPKNLLQNLTQVFKNQGKTMDVQFTHKYDASTKKWEAQLKLMDSANGAHQTRIHKGIHTRKSNAEANAALAAVAYLIDKGILDRKGRLVVGGKEEKRRKLQDRRAQPVEVSLTKQQLDLCEKFLREYARLLSPALDAVIDSDCDAEAKSSDVIVPHSPEEKNVHILTGSEVKPMSSEQRADLNRRLSEESCRRSQRRCASKDIEQTNLPISFHRDKLLEMIDKNQVLIVAGETGSGKSTQLPQYILDQYIERGTGADCGVVVTQPRRISALSLSERVAFERDEQLGESVGYQVRLDARLPRLNGFVFYCTTATMVNMLRGVASSFKRIHGLTHLIIDEVHTRDAHIDILLTSIKLLLKTNPNVRVILMSASMDHALLSKYFDNCPVVDIPGRAFPVTERFLPEVMRQIGYSPDEIQYTGEQLRQDPGYLLRSDLMLRTIEMIDKRRPPGAVLCFLPGWQEIQMVNRALCASKWYNSGRHVIHRLHSKIPLAEQRRVFERVRPGQRKIILATNVAESSITVDDVRYVVDTGLHRDTFFDADRNTTCLKLARTAKASTTQRKGRAGRVAAGECFLLFSRDSYENARDFPLPEIKRMPLETVCLESRLLTPDVAMPVAEFVNSMPEPPVAADVEQAVQRLVELGVFTRSAPPVQTSGAGVDFRLPAAVGAEQLTDLGRRIAHFTSHPRMSIALLYSRLLHCTGPLVSVASMYTSSREPFLSNIGTGGETIRVRKRQLAENCDWQALSHLMRLYRECRGDEYAVEQFCRRFQLDGDTLKFIDGSRAIFVKHLADAYLLNDIEEAERGQEEAASDDRTAGECSPPSLMRSASVNENELSDVFVRAAICAGYGDQAAKILGADLISGGSKQSERRRVFMLDEGRTGELAMQSAVEPTSLPEQALIVYAVKRIYERDRHNRAVLMSDATHVHPLHVLLFTRRLTPKIDAEANGALITFEELPFLKMRCSTRHEAEILLKLRTAIHRAVEHAISAVELRGEIIHLLAQLREIVANCIPQN